MSIITVTHVPSTLIDTVYTDSTVKVDLPTKSKWLGGIPVVLVNGQTARQIGVCTVEHIASSPRLRRSPGRPRKEERLVSYSFRPTGVTKTTPVKSLKSLGESIVSCVRNNAIK
jgi:hypothetical protein